MKKLILAVSALAAIRGLASADDNRPLLAAAAEGDLAAVQTLVARGADVNAYTAAGATPLCLAAKNGYLGIVTFLVQHGAVLGPVGLFDGTPLHAAARGGNLKVVEYLLGAGAAPTYKNRVGQVAAEVACADVLIASLCPKARIVKALLDKEQEDAARRTAEAEAEAAAKEQAEVREKEAQELAQGKIVWRHAKSPAPELFEGADESQSVWENLNAAVSAMASRRFRDAIGEKPAPPATLTQDKYESRGRFEQRVAAARRDYEEALRKYKDRAAGYGLSSARRNEMIQDAVNRVFGLPRVAATRYDPDSQVFSVEVVSDGRFARDFRQTFLLTEGVPNERAREVDAALQGAIARVTFQAEGSKLVPVAADFNLLIKTYRGLPAPENAVSRKPAEVDLSGLGKALAAAAPEEISVSYRGDSPEVAEKLAELNKLRQAKANEEEIHSLDARIAELRKNAAVHHSDVDNPGFAPLPEHAHDFALVVGVESYQSKGLPPADFAERDAEAVARHLRALGVPPGNLILLKGSEATAGQIKGYLQSWLPKNAAEDSKVYFYFSGHGAPEPATRDAYLLSWDGNPQFLEHTALSLSDVYGALGRLKTKKILVAMDACFSGAGGRSVIQRGARPLVAVNEGALPPGLTVLAAAAQDETAQGLEKEGHGIFTYFLLKALGEGKRGTQELCRYVTPKVRETAARENRTQSPVCRGPEFGF